MSFINFICYKYIGKKQTTKKPKQKQSILFTANLISFSQCSVIDIWYEVQCTKVKFLVFTMIKCYGSYKKMLKIKLIEIY